MIFMHFYFCVCCLPVISCEVSDYFERGTWYNSVQGYDRKKRRLASPSSGLSKRDDNTCY